MCGPKFCSMRISHDIRNSARESSAAESGEQADDAAIELGLRQKADEFRASGGEVYLPAG